MHICQLFSIYDFTLEILISHIHEIGKRKDDNQDHHQEVAHIGDSLYDQLNVSSITFKKSEPIEHFNPHPKHDPTADILDEILFEVPFFINKINEEHH